MDGTLADIYKNGRRMRPASTEYASEVYPRMIVHLLMDKLIITVLNRIETKPVVVLTSKVRNKSDYYVLLMSDFNICKTIAENLTLNLFTTDIEQDAINRARAQVELLFAGRN